MIWLILAGGVMWTTLMLAAMTLWRRLKKLEDGRARRPEPGAALRGAYDSVELSLEAMLEELEAKGRDILKKIDRRERELNDVLDQSNALARRLTELLAAPSASRPDPPGVADDPRPEQSAPPDPLDKAAAVRRLATEGLDTVEIAQRLGLGKGEVRLILDLTEQQ